MSNPHRFAFTHLGVVPHGTDVPMVGDEVIAAGAALEAAVSAPEVLALPTPTPVAPKLTAATAGISPKTVVQMARLRVKEIKAELKNHRALERELAQLENLLKAATKPTHLAPVRQLSSRK